jgi:FlaA1/EpsC-like NDP-sugar epimerase
VIRLFKIISLRTLVLLGGEVFIVWTSFVLATIWRNPDSLLLLNVDGGYFQVLAALAPKILVVTGVVLLLSHFADLYDSSRLRSTGEHAVRLFLVVGSVALGLYVLTFRYPSLLPGNYSAVWGLIILTFTLFGWRAAYSWMVRQPFLRERVYVLGTGERAERLLRGLRKRSAM